jgi:hypothetical protein
MDPNTISLGSLIRYIDLSDNVVYGLVIKQLAVDTELGTFDGPAVEIRWFDDDAVTTEFVSSIKNGENSMEIINEN